ncbi:chromate efflux transporter [Virgibacillus sp. MSP4-1]|nr:chromate efflux transporter [Virgibacillus sp. MSP4-1]QHS24391.1 chromate efflux transporter [Virgibacillus sp. MSP4-1]
MGRYLEILAVSFRLGLTSFGGPVAHLGYFQDEYVKRRKWLDDRTYADLIALCQFLPGPASSQVGISIGMVRGGVLGGLLAWIGFTLPSVVALIVFALYVQQVDTGGSVWIEGLKLVAVAVVAHAILNMGKKLTPDQPRIAMAVLAAIAVLFYQTALAQISVIVLAGIFGYLLFKHSDLPEGADIHLNLRKSIGMISLILFFGLLLFLPVMTSFFPNIYVQLVDIFYRIGSIVFGGGHVVLPLLEREVVPPGLISEEVFLAGYGAAQAVPGPLFTFSSFIGTSIEGISGGLVAVLAMFFPSFLLLIGVLPFWNTIRKKKSIRAALLGVNAAVVGILIAALYDPIWTSAVDQTKDFAVVLASFAFLYFWKVPAWLIVIFTVLFNVVLSGLL